MLPKKERLTTEEFTVVMEKGRVTHSPLFLIRLLKSPETGGPAKFAAIASKKIAKTAVSRNKMRRRIYEAISETMKKLGESKKKLESGHVAVFAKETATKADYQVIVTDLEQLFVKAGIIK